MCSYSSDYICSSILNHANNENMQMKASGTTCSPGVFEAATIHYAVAKIFGLLIFGRGELRSCVLDRNGDGNFLPYKCHLDPRKKKIGWIRYTTFVAAFSSYRLYSNIERIMFFAFIIGNALYYSWNRYGVCI